MRIRDEITERDELIGQLAVTYALLAMAPYDSWRHEGTPAQMAAFVVAESAKRGNLGMLTEAVLGSRTLRARQ